MLKKVYIEITNSCNLSCDFCIQNKKDKKFITKSEFNTILKKLKGHTSYLYFHILGEPLLHPNIKEFIDIASTNFNINITTNGYLIDRIKDVNNIRQLNISLHSYDSKYKKSVNEYMNDIFNVVDNMNNTYIQYRIWVNNKYTKEIINILNEHYNTCINIDEIDNNKTLKDNIFISKFHKFIWPDLNNDYYNEKGACYALRDHIGILSDGTIIPCCLDTRGNINLGNIYSDDLSHILKSKRCINMLDGFKNKEKREELCKHCSFIDK